MLITIKMFHAHPAKLVLTIVASHMIATALLHNGNVALWTWFCIPFHPAIAFFLSSSQFPVERLLELIVRKGYFILAFLLRSRTSYAIVPREAACPAKIMLTILTEKFLVLCVSVHPVLTAGGGAPKKYVKKSLKRR